MAQRGRRAGYEERAPPTSLREDGRVEMFLLECANGESLTIKRDVGCKKNKKNLVKRISPCGCGRGERDEEGGTSWAKFETFFLLEGEISD